MPDVVQYHDVNTFDMARRAHAQFNSDEDVVIRAHWGTEWSLERLLAYYDEHVRPEDERARRLET